MFAKNWSMRGPPRGIKRIPPSPSVPPKVGMTQYALLVTLLTPARSAKGLPLTCVA